MNNVKGREAFLAKIGVDTKIQLSKQETRSLKGLLKGYTATQIAIQLHLSRRTIEHHIVQIKSKLSCFSKTELVQRAQELECLGLLN